MSVKLLHAKLLTQYKKNLKTYCSGKVVIKSGRMLNNGARAAIIISLLMTFCKTKWRVLHRLSVRCETILQ